VLEPDLQAFIDVENEAAREAARADRLLREFVRMAEAGEFTDKTPEEVKRLAEETYRRLGLGGDSS
jgi:hypothetical protein